MESALSVLELVRRRFQFPRISFSLNTFITNRRTIGGIIYPVIFHRLQPRVGFAWATRTIGFVVLGSQLIGLALVRERILPTRGVRRRLVDPTAFKDAPFMILLLSILFVFVSMYNPFIYISSYAVQKHITSTNLGFYILAITNAATIFGRTIPAIIGDRLTGIINMAMVIYALCGILSFVWIKVDSVAGVIVWALGYGFVGGAAISMVVVTPIPFTPGTNLVGTRIGMGSGVAAIGKLIGSPSVGQLLKDSRSLSYTGLQVFTGAFLLAGTVALAIARLMKTKGKVFVKI